LREQLLEGNFRLDRQRSNVTVYRRLGQPAQTALTLEQYSRQTALTLELEGFRLDAKCLPLVFLRGSGSG